MKTIIPFVVFLSFLVNHAFSQVKFRVKKLNADNLVTLIIFFLFSMNIPLFSQSCLPEGIIFTKQSQIDSFQINYPGCTEIEGFVDITGNDISNLKGLEVLTYIGGNVCIEKINTLLSLTGLHNITAIGGGLNIYEVPRLLNLKGLNKLSSIGGALTLNIPDDPTDLSGLGNLNTVGDSVLIRTRSLKNLTGLNNLTSIGGTLRIEDCYSLTNLSALANLNYIGGDFWAEDNVVMVNLTGLNNLTSIGRDLYIEDYDRMVNLTGLNNVTSIGGKIYIEGNNGLTSLTGLENIDAGSINELCIFINTILSKCEVQSICEYLVSPNGKIVIYDNAPGCNSVEEIKEACESSCLPEGITFSSQAQIDNFKTSYPDCTDIGGDVEIVSSNGNSISDLSGLNNITSIGGFLKIEGNEELTSLTGLDNVTYIGSDLSLIMNNSLTNLVGLDNLTSIGGDLSISGNENLSSLTGLINVAYIGEDLLIEYNRYLVNLTGLNNLTYVGENLWIKNNDALTSLTGLDNIDASYINNISIQNNSSLTYCEVLSMCNFIGFSSGNVDIYDNASGCNNLEEIANVCGVSVSDNIGMLRKESEIKDLRIQQTRVFIFGLGAIILIIIVGTIIVIRQRKIRAQHTLELERVKSEKLKELDRLKSRFFANISHEFRTPLTLIKGPLEKALSLSENENQINELGIAKKYANKLQILINNLLTISKLESGKMLLHTSEIDIVKLVRSYLQSFESLAKQKYIALNFKSEEKEINANIDREKFEQVLNNLLSNAFKFTGEGGVVEVAVCSRQYAKNSIQSAVGKNEAVANCQLPTANSSGQCAEIKISDTGHGIAPEHINHVFDRFYQAGQEDNSYYEGTGIGLTLTKELIELHHGTIKVDSQSEKGSTFTILLPLGKDHLKPEEIVVEKPEKITAPVFLPAMPYDKEESTTVKDTATETNNNHSILLIVEDNSDMRSYIRGYFETEYKIIEAIDGADGYEKSTKHIPNIIISDVMMPKMDGVEFCKKVKADERTSHIPIILLTARASKESRMEGLETGADDFITKPFDGDELQVRVKNLIEQRRRLSIKLEKKIQKSQNSLVFDFEDSGITTMDEQFLQKVVEKVKEHHSDPEFNAKEFSLIFGLSVAQLNRKIKALTSQTTGEFIRTFRLIRAAELIKNKTATVAEIAYDVGFGSPSYFSECFRLHFGKLPSEFNEIN